LKLEMLELRALMHGASEVSLDIAPVLVGTPAEYLDTGPATSLSITMLTAASASADAQASAGADHDHEHHDHVIEVTATEIITAHDIVPRFAAQPTISAVRSGSWFDPTVWSLARLPQAGDRVAIAAGINLTYGSVSDASLDAIEISGSLRFATQVNTRLKVGTLTVMPDGVLEIGTAAAPIGAQVKAELILADKALNLATDPRQFGTALIVFGEFTVHGAAHQQTWTRLAAEAQAGNTSILVEGGIGDWRAGDTIIVPDTRQLSSGDEYKFFNGLYVPQWEEAVISRVEGNRVFLTRPLTYSHLGARAVDGRLELLGHVALLDRNVVIRSENPAGTRGHTFYGARADIDIRYARFKDLGRTDAFRTLNNSTFDANGAATHLGTNQVGRYAVHMHHLLGPENATNTGYQYQFVGNTVDGSRRWAVAVHDTHFGLVDNNVVYDAQGSGFVTEDGSEIGNEITRNITIRIQGTLEDGKAGTATGDYGRGGVGFWFRRSGNIVRGNVAADSNFDGLVNFIDYQAWRANFSQSIPGPGSGAGIVPESTSAVLMILAAFFLAPPVARCTRNTKLAW